MVIVVENLERKWLLFGIPMCGLFGKLEMRLSFLKKTSTCRFCRVVFYCFCLSWVVASSFLCSFGAVSCASSCSSGLNRTASNGGSAGVGWSCLSLSRSVSLLCYVV